MRGSNSRRWALCVGARDFPSHLHLPIDVSFVADRTTAARCALGRGAIREDFQQGLAISEWLFLPANVRSQRNNGPMTDSIQLHRTCTVHVASLMIGVILINSRKVRRKGIKLRNFANILDGSSDGSSRPGICLYHRWYLSRDDMHINVPEARWLLIP